MKRLFIGFACLAALTVVCFVGIGQAMASVDLNFVVTPADLADGPTFLNGQGGVPFGYDPDSVKPIGSTQDGPSGFGSGSFWADVQGSAAGGGVDYTAIRLSPKDVFSFEDVTIADLSEISYHTKWVSDLDWQLKIYTEGTDKWYGYRFNFTRPSFGDNEWNLSSTDTNLTVSDVHDKSAGKYVSVPGTGQLADLDALYGDEKILFIDIAASYASNSPPSDSYLDGIFIKLDSGDTATIDLQPVPEPTSLAIWGLLGAGCAGAAMRRRRNRNASTTGWSNENRQAIHQIIENGRASE